MARDFAKAFYRSAAWVACRDSYIAKRRGLCERCLSRGLFRAGKIVHHKIYLTPENIVIPGIALNHANLELLCQPACATPSILPATSCPNPEPPSPRGWPFENSLGNRCMESRKALAGAHEVFGRGKRRRAAGRILYRARGARPDPTENGPKNMGNF